MKNTYRKSKIIEIIAAVLINIIVGTLIYCNMSGSSALSETKKAIKHMNFMIEAAYEESSEADRINVSKVDMKNCSIVKSNGEWYMICDLDDVLNGNENAQRAVMDKFRGLMPVSELNLENIHVSGKEHAIFLRSSSSDKNRG